MSRSALELPAIPFTTHGALRTGLSMSKHFRDTTMDFILFYDVTPEYIVRRSGFRKDHLRLAWEYADRGELILGGALDEPVDAAILVFRCGSRETVEQFVARDPYVANGLIASWRIRPWKTVVGSVSATPLRPESL